MVNLVWERSNGYFVKRMTVGAGIVAGDPVEIVDLHGVAVTSYSAADGMADVAFSGIDFVQDVLVEAVNNTVGSAGAIGDEVYYDTAATIKVNKDGVAGKLYGYALEAIAISASDTINVACVN